MHSVLAAGSGWSGAAAISPAGQPDPTRGSQLNDVAVNASGLTLVAWDQYTYNNGGGATIGVAMQSAGRWGAPFTISGAAGFSMSPRVAVGADGDAGVAFAVSPYTPTTGACGAALQGTCVLYAFRTGPNGAWTLPWNVTETLASIMGYVTNPQVALDTNGLATIVYMGNNFEGVRQTMPVSTFNPEGFWTTPATIIKSPVAGASYMSIDLAIDGAGNAVAALSIFDPTPGVDRSSAWAARADSAGVWSPAVRLTDPTVPVDAYATRVAVSPADDLAFVGWIDHYHGIVQVTQWAGSAWGKATTIGKSTAFSAFQEVLGLDVADTNKARAIWKSAKSGTRIYAASYN